MKSLWLVALLILISFQVKSQIIDLSIIAEIESSNNNKAINKLDGGSRGKYQIHPIGLADYNKIHKTKITLDSLFDEETNKMIALWMFQSRIPQLLSYYGYYKNTTNILICYNAGIGYLVYKQSIPKSTRSYISKYMKLRQEKNIRLSKVKKL